MSSESSLKKMCHVKRLDFENCVFGGFKTAGRRRKKRMRAKFMKDSSLFEKTPERTSKIKIKETGDLTESPVLLSKGRTSSSSLSRQSIETIGSPVLRCRRDASPVSRSKVIFRSKRKINFGDETVSKSPILSSPVFKIKMSDGRNNKKKRQKTNPDESSLKNVDLTQRLLEANVGNSRNLTNESTKENSSIEEFTQRTDSIPGISSVESPPNLLDSIVIDSSLSETKTPSLSANVDYANERPQEDQLIRKTYRRGGLLNRLKHLLGKQYSEKLLWEHLKKGSSPEAEVLTLENHWNFGGNYFLKCRPRFSTGTASEKKYIVCNAKWISGLKSDGKETVSIRVHPPWQKLMIGKPETTVLLNVFCLELCEKVPIGASVEANEPEFKNQFIARTGNGQVDLLYDTLLSFPVSPFLL